MIYSPPQHAEIRYRPSYTEVANTNILQRYQTTEGELTVSRETSEYVRRTIATIELKNALDHLASLPANWNTYGSEKPSQEAVSAAAAIGKEFINFGLVPDAIAPSAEGGIAICFARNQKYADVECFNSGDILAVRYSSHEDPEVWAIQPNAVGSDATVETISKYLSA